MNKQKQFTEMDGPVTRVLYSHPVFNAPEPPNDPVATSLSLYSLGSLVEYLKQNPDGLDRTKVFVRVVSPSSVTLHSPLFGRKQRESLIAAAYLSPLENFLGSFHSLTDFRIGLGTRFQGGREDDREQILDVLARVRAENSELSDDNGLSQTITAQSGAITLSREQIQNPVRLSPYRSFPEAGEQVTSEFVLRLQQEKQPGTVARAALFLADGGAWEYTARWQVADFLRTKLTEAEVNVAVYH
ncbi:MAG TPA: hypothetical protein VGS22_16375 [Thermoanaerobaculia bacterium]|jgi:hypothetical protein|nr:hypothetical protein [Thermoanaerobaculia bacterium]